jgi:hypothetical protein
MDFITSSRDELAAGGAQMPPAPARTPSRAAPAPAVRGLRRPPALPARRPERAGGALPAWRHHRPPARTQGQALYREGERFLFLYAVRFGTFKSTAMLNSGSDQVTGFTCPAT